MKRETARVCKVAAWWRYATELSGCKNARWRAEKASNWYRGYGDSRPVFRKRERLAGLVLRLSPRLKISLWVVVRWMRSSMWVRLMSSKGISWLLPFWLLSWVLLLGLLPNVVAGLSREA